MRYKSLNRKICRFLILLLIISNSLIGLSRGEIVHAAGLPNGVQDFTGYKFNNHVGTSPDGFFTITSSRTPLIADESIKYFV